MGSRLVVALAAVVAFGCSVAVRAQNSTRKERRAPSVLAARAGSAVAWQSSVEAALTAAKAAHKRVFWYVPTVARSPMDRQPEIDRYLRGGPLSWPSTLTLLANHFVCTDEVPAGALQERFGLVRQKFIEPGYLVLDAEGAVQLRVDQLTTLHPEWFEAPLRRLVGAPAEGFPGAPALREAWQAYRTGDVAAVGRFVATVLQAEPSSATAAEAWWLRGASLFRSGEPSAARAAWRELAARLPDEPLAWKAQLEIEGHGPFVHGFEDYLELPAAVLTQDPVDGTRAPGVYDEAELWQRSVRFLLAMDDGTGMVRDSIYDFGGTDGLPNVWAATTCLVGMALLAADARVARKHLELGKDERRLGRMLQRIRDKVVNESWLALSDRDEIVWARAYAVRFLAAWARRYPRERDEVLPELRGGVGALLALQPETGVWFHEYGTPFATATALQALHEARELGCEVD
ncbi:MAG: hypothetical protein KDE27_08140, partial [Planctomycetes bacterium]|nr:hypothetical protein [Planctomycetota bacterium]